MAAKANTCSSLMVHLMVQASFRLMSSNADYTCARGLPPATLLDENSNHPVGAIVWMPLLRTNGGDVGRTATSAEA